MNLMLQNHALSVHLENVHLLATSLGYFTCSKGCCLLELHTDELTLGSK
jgi:hypothetical protein